MIKVQNDNLDPRFLGIQDYDEDNVHTSLLLHLHQAFHRHAHYNNKKNRFRYKDESVHLFLGFKKYINV